MKICISIFLIFSHLFSTIGFSMEVHECGGEKSYTFLGVSFNSLCECNHESEDHDDGCCKDKKTIIKAEHQDKQTCKIFVAKSFSQDFVVTNHVHLIDKDVFSNRISFSSVGKEHPPNHSPPLYVLYNVFLI